MASVVSSAAVFHQHAILTSTTNNKHNNDIAVDSLKSLSSSSSSSSKASKFLSSFATSSFMASSTSLIKDQTSSLASSSPPSLLSAALAQPPSQVILNTENLALTIDSPKESDSQKLFKVKPEDDESSLLEMVDKSDTVVSIVKDENHCLLMQMIDESSSNSTTSSVQSTSSTPVARKSSSSSSSNENSPRKKKRRGEDEMLMHDLLGIDRSLAVTIQRSLSSKDNNNNCNDTIKNDDSVNDASSVNQCDDKKIKSVANNRSRDSPAAHLRPRRNIKPPPYTSCYATGSGSVSPLYLNSIKRGNKCLVKPETQKLLVDTSRQLSQLLTLDRQNHFETESKLSTKSEPDSVDPKVMDHCVKSELEEGVASSIDASVFATLITPSNLDSSTCYSYNYVSLKIVDHKPIRYVELNSFGDGNRKVMLPMLELTTVDLCDRFKIDFLRGVFDDPNTTNVLNTTLTVFLLGSYAIRSKDLVKQCFKGSGSPIIINVISFRTSALKSTFTRNVKKRKLIGSKEYAFSIIVDSPHNDPWFHENQKNNNKENGSTLFGDVDIKCEDTEEDDVVCLDDPFVEIYQATTTTKSISTENQSNENDQFEQQDWLPIVSFTNRWKAPDDPQELNRTLYLEQPCVPKFESSSRTVKMHK